MTPDENATITIPAFHAGGGMSFGELVILGRVTKGLKPRMVFEMGTYNGLVTAVFLLNSEPDAIVITMDLPIASEYHSHLRTDQELVESRQIGSVPRALGLSGRYTQILCDSMAFDPTPYLDSVDLGLIDAAHDLPHVENDTLKMASMISDGGMVFWHDYGGKGSLRPLASYLNALGRRASLYRIRDTSLAWAPGRELKQALQRSAQHGVNC
jgi:hypothetical protein